MKKIYPIIDKDFLKKNNFHIMVHFLIKNNINMVQIRVSKPYTYKLLKKILLVKKICKKNNCKFIINNDLLIAKFLNADGVHIGQNDSSPLMARKILGSNKIIGVSCGNNMRIASTYNNPYVKYISFGSAFKTKTKKNIKVLKISNVYDYKLDSETKTCIIGGINDNNLSDKILNKFDLIAMSSAIRKIPDIIKINKLYKKFCNE